jgi:hypothetical protein
VRRAKQDEKAHPDCRAAVDLPHFSGEALIHSAAVFSN